MRDNRDPQLLGEQLLELRKQHKKKKLSQVQDIATSTGVALGLSVEDIYNVTYQNGQNGHGT